MFVEKLADGLNILRKYGKHGNIDYVANSFPNGTPNNPTRCYVCVELDDYIGHPVPDDEGVNLRGLGWVPEQDGLYWLFYG